ncbi:MAG: hypothetical protein KDD60_00050 [Bdellovibrionales bacterium]|nr:hypothetical protein [Bdellovibrionales bacterium]
MSSNVVQLDSEGLIKRTVRLRREQWSRLEGESRARGNKIADVLRENLDLAFSIKEEFAQVLETNGAETAIDSAPRVIHSLLFAMEQRVIAALDGLARKLDTAPITLASSEDVSANEAEDELLPRLERLVRLIAPEDQSSAKLWLGCMLNISQRLEAIKGTELEDKLRTEADEWLVANG